MEPEFDETVAVEDLMELERRFVAEERGPGGASRRSRFEYGWGLVRSPYRSDVGSGLRLLGELLPGAAPDERRDFLFYLALGYYRLKEYERALGLVEQLLAAEPHNQQGQRLRQRVRQRMHTEGLLGAAIVGGLALGVAGLAGLLGLAVARARR